MPSEAVEAAMSGSPNYGAWLLALLALAAAAKSEVRGNVLGDCARRSSATVTFWREVVG